MLESTGVFYFCICSAGMIVYEVYDGTRKYGWNMEKEKFEFRVFNTLTATAMVTDDRAFYLHKCFRVIRIG